MTPSDDLVDSVSEQHRLLLTAVLSETAPARRAWSAWCDVIEFDDVDGPSLRLLPSLALRPDVISADDPLHGRIRGLYRRSWVSNEQLRSASASARTALVTACVPILHVEALPLIAAIGDHAIRPLHDIDFCVPRGSMRTVTRILEGLDWTCDPQGLRARVQHRPRHFVRESARLRVIDGVPWPGAHSSAWEMSPVDESGEQLLDVHDALVHACVRSTQPWQKPAAQWVADTAWLSWALGYQRISDGLDDERIIDRAGVHGSSEVVAAALLAADRIVGVSRSRRA